MNTGELTEALAALKDEVARLKESVAVLRAELNSSKALELMARVTTQEERVSELKRAREESDRWSRQLVALGVGAALALLGGVTSQLVLLGVRPATGGNPPAVQR